LSRSWESCPPLIQAKTSCFVDIGEDLVFLARKIASPEERVAGGLAINLGARCELATKMKVNDQRQMLLSQVLDNDLMMVKHSLDSIEAAEENVLAVTKFLGPSSSLFGKRTLFRWLALYQSARVLRLLHSLHIFEPDELLSMFSYCLTPLKTILSAFPQGYRVLIADFIASNFIVAGNITGTDDFDINIIPCDQICREDIPRKVGECASKGTEDILLCLGRDIFALNFLELAKSRKISKDVSLGLLGYTVQLVSKDDQNVSLLMPNPLIVCRPSFEDRAVEMKRRSKLDFVSLPDQSQLSYGDVIGYCKVNCVHASNFLFRCLTSWFSLTSFPT